MKTFNEKLRKSIARIVWSRSFGWLVNLPPVSWMIRIVSRKIVSREIGEVSEAPSLAKQVTTTGLQATLESIVSDVVEGLGFPIAMLATYEQGDVLPIRAILINPHITNMEQVHKWEEQISAFDPDNPLSLTDPDIARTYVYDDHYKDNLSVRATRERQLIVSNHLYDLFRPIAPTASRPIIRAIQDELGIEQVVAVPFFLGEEVVGNLFTGKQSQISEPDKHILTAFGRQAAAAIEGERRRLQAQIAQDLVLQLQTGIQNEKEILQRIAEGIVSELDYVGVMVSTYEQEDDSLPVRAFFINPTIATMDKIREWEKQVSDLDPENPVSLTDPGSPYVARVYVHDDHYKDNLGVKASLKHGLSFSDDLYELLVPVAPLSSKPIIKGIQEELGIKKLIAVPFFLGDELVGNLFTATRSRSFSNGEIELLEAFGQQAAAGIRNARLYRTIQELYQKAEDRRQVAAVFGKMAFSAATSVHNFRNHIGFIRGQLQLLPYIEQFSKKDRGEIIKSMPRVIERLDIIAELLTQLHEPWRPVDDKPTSVNNCLIQAKDKVVPEYATNGITVNLQLTDSLPFIKTSPDMLVEAFRILIKNAVEAIHAQSNQGGILKIESSLYRDSSIKVQIQDNGLGIKSADLNKIFELSWTTKEAGLGFGLFWTKDYIEGLGGQIHVESKWQKGTTFCVYLSNEKGLS